MTQDTETYDFIVVGGGPAGCLLSARLAKAFPTDKILLVEAGGDNLDPQYKKYGERHFTLMSAPGYNWGYKTTPQDQCAGREIDYSRGKGLGGSTAINFCIYTRGPKDDYEQWRASVGDDVWSWEQAQLRLNKFERFHPPSSDCEPYVKPANISHGFEGAVDVGSPEVWDRNGFGTFMDAVCTDHPLNLDHNSGDPVGVSIAQISAYKGGRTTASSAFLTSPPKNLTIKTDMAVERVLLEDHKAIGIEVQGQQIRGGKEVILSAGALDTPKLLLLSGIGPKGELDKHKIQQTLELPAIGQGLQDHSFLELITTRKEGSHHRTFHISSPDFFENARKKYAESQSGPISQLCMPQTVSFLKAKGLTESQEFKDLTKQDQKYITAKTIPDYEIISHTGTPTVQAPSYYLGFALGFMHPLSRGSVTLRSSNPSDQPLSNPQFFSHQFDRRTAIESVRGALDFLNTPALAKDQLELTSGPKGRSDDEIWEYISTHAMSMWHMCGTARMGPKEDPSTCVDTSFRVHGIQGLRVVDMSVAPFVPSAHTQSFAYLIGEIASEKIITEYS